MWFVYMFSCTIWLGHNFTHLQQNRPPTLRELPIGEGSWNLFLLKLYKRVWVNIWRRPPTLYRWTVRINKPPSFLVGDGAREHLKLCCKELELQTDEAKSRWVHRAVELMKSIYLPWKSKCSGTRTLDPDVLDQVTMFCCPCPPHWKVILLCRNQKEAQIQYNFIICLVHCNFNFRLPIVHLSFLHSSCLGCLSSQLEIKKWLCSATLTLVGAETTAGTETASRLLGSTIFH